MSSNKDINFRFVPEGHGGTFSFCKNEENKSEAHKQNIDHIEYIGTLGIHTCVGVYFKIDHTRACCMHINACSRVDFPKNLVSIQDGEIVKKTLVNRLQLEAMKENWEPGDEYFGNDFLVVCPEPEFESTDGEINKRTAWYVIQGLREFFDEEANKLHDEAMTIDMEAGSALASAKTQGRRRTKKRSQLDEQVKALRNKAEFLHQTAVKLTPDTVHEGFVVQHRTGATKLFEVEADPKPSAETPKRIGYWVPQIEPRLAFPHAKEWYISPYDTSSSQDLARNVMQKINRNMESP